MIRDIVLRIKAETGMEAIGIRLNEGDDFPYYETKGFSEEFVQMERYLCAYDQTGKVVRDDVGNTLSSKRFAPFARLQSAQSS